MINVVRNSVLLVTFVLELFSGFFVLGVALFFASPSPSSNNYNYNNNNNNNYSNNNNEVQEFKETGEIQKKKKRVLTTRSQQTIILQLVLMGAVDIFSSILCFMMVSFDLSGLDSWYLTYIQWGIATPPMIVVLCLVCSLDVETTVALAFLDGIIILSGAMASLFEQNELKYTWFSIGGLFFLILFGIFFKKREAITRQIDRSLRNEEEDEKEETKSIKEEVRRDQRLSSRLILITLTTWSLYPITWLIEETNVINKSDADIIHSVFAMFAKVTFGFVLTYYRTRLSGGNSYGLFAIPVLLSRLSNSPSSSRVANSSSTTSLSLFSSSSTTSFPSSSSTSSVSGSPLNVREIS